jgi:hypothetical protein
VNDDEFASERMNIPKIFSTWNNKKRGKILSPFFLLPTGRETKTESGF